MTYEQIATEIQLLSKEQRKKLIALIVDSLTVDEPEEKHSLLELEGLGAELWEGIDPQKYVDELRDEWDQHS